jgi:hypothetical protein
VTYLGKTKTIAEWSKQTGLPIGAIRKRLQHGWTIEQALTTPLGVNGRPRKGPAFEPFAAMVRQHEQMRMQLEAMFRQFIRGAQLELGQLSADYLNSVRDQANTMARDAVKNMPGASADFPACPTDRCPTSAPERS